MQETFHGIGDEHLKNIKKRAGELHRQFRGRLRSLAKDENGNYSAEPPAEYASFSSVTPYWKEFVEQARKEEFKVFFKSFCNDYVYLIFLLGINLVLD